MSIYYKLVGKFAYLHILTIGYSPDGSGQAMRPLKYKLYTNEN